MFTELTIKDKSYKLRLTTKGSIQLEKALGYNPITLLLNIDKGEMPTLTEMLIILHATLQPFNHGFDMDAVYDLYDDYIAGGKTMFDLVPVFIEVFQESGYIAKTDTAIQEDEKN